MELKTLKDLDNTCKVKGYESWISPIALKQEAIKWVKENTIEEIDLWSQGRNMGLMRMAEFFNITEEDLK